MPEPAAQRRLLLPAMAGAVLAIASAATFVRVADPLPPGVIAALRVSTTGLVLMLFTLGSTREAVSRCLRNRELGARVLLAAAMLALHFGAWITSLTMTSVVRSIALVSTQPIFAGFLGAMIGDRAPRRLYLGSAVAIAGAGLMASGPAASAAGEQALRGDALALLGGVTAAAYLTIGRSVGDRLPLRGYFVLVNVLAGAMLAAFAGLIGADWTGPHADGLDYLAVFYLGIVPGIVGHGLLNWAVRRVPVHVVSLTVLLEPLGAGVIAWLALGEVVSAAEAGGAALLLVGVALGLPRDGGRA